MPLMQFWSETVHGMSAHPLYAQSASVEQAKVVLATQALSDVLPAGDVVPEGHGEQFVAPGDVE